MTEELLVTRDGSVTTLTLNRPEKLNALNAGLVEALIASVEAASSDGTRLCVITGAGKGFSGGFDFGGIEQASDGDLALRFLRIEMLLQAVYHAPFTTMALAHAACFGAAADLLAVCGRRIAAPDCRFRMPGLRFGVVLGTGRLARTIGANRARRLLEMSKVFGAEEAQETGFIHDVMPREGWKAAIEAARQDAEALPVTSQRALLDQTTDDQRDADLAALARSVAEPGLSARIRAYVEANKRKP